MKEPDRIEEALRRLGPAAMPARLMARLTAARPQAHTAAKFRWGGVIARWVLPLVASACVAVATFFWLEHDGQPDEQPGANVAPEHRPMPVESQDYLLAARPVGILVAPDQRPYRIMDVEWLEHQTVRSGDGRPVFHTATTRRDVVPVALELY